MSMDHKCTHCGHIFLWGRDADSAIVTNPTCAENAYWKLHDHMQAEHPDEMFTCPRQCENPHADKPSAYWNGDGTCSYCGSISPDALFAAIAAGAELGPTDKNYKVYVDIPNPDVGKPAIYSTANHQPEGDGWFQLTAERAEELGLDSYARHEYVGRWVRLDKAKAVLHAKFYFQHLSHAEQGRFIDLLNAKAIKIGFPGHFYRVPFFCVPAPKEQAA